MIMTMSHSKSGTNNSNSNTNTNNNNNPPNHHQLTPPLSLSPLASIPPPLSSHRVNHAVTMSAFPHGARLPARVRLSDITPYDGALCGTYLKAVEALSGSLMRCNAAVIELGSNDAAIMRCGLEAARLYFRNRAGTAGKGSRGVYMYRTGRALEDSDSSPPCMAESFRCLGKAARAVLCAIARHLRLRSDVFNHLLDDNPLPANEASSSLLVATYLHAPGQNGKGAIGGGKPSSNGEFEKGLLTLISSDTPGLQVCDPNGRWYLADSDLGSGSVLLLTGKALSHATAGLRPAATYRAASDISSGSGCVGRSSLAFRLMPQSNAILDCSLTTAAGHVIPHSYAPISVSQFMDDLAAEEDTLCNHADSTFVEQNNTIKEQNNTIKEPSLRIVLSDPLSGVFLEDAMVVSCGHSFGGLMLRKVIEASRCMLCHSEIETRSLIPNLALRAAAAAVKQEDDRRLFHNAAFRKRRREIVNQIDLGRRINKEDEDTTPDIGLQRVPYPFAVNEKVVIKGNRRTPDKFVGKEAIVTSHCLNGWYLLKIVESGESVRLQYRSLRKHTQTGEERCASDPIQSSRREHNS